MTTPQTPPVAGAPAQTAPVQVGTDAPQTPPVAGAPAQTASVQVGTDVVCSACGKKLMTVQAVERVSLAVHCPFDGSDFGVTVVPAGETAETPEQANPPAGGWRQE